MSLQYTLHEKGEPHHEQPRKRAAFLTRVHFKLDHATGPFHIRRDGGDTGPERTQSEVETRVRSWTQHALVGARMDIVAQDTVLNLHTVQVAPPIAPPNTSPPIALVYIRVFTKHGYVTNLGNWYCRYIAGTNEVSRHGYYSPADGWFGDAQDFGCPTADQLSALASEIVGWVTDSTDMLYGKLEHVIVHDRIWTKGSGWSHYDGIYHYHVHCDNASGIPCHP